MDKIGIKVEDKVSFDAEGFTIPDFFEEMVKFWAKLKLQNAS